MTLKQAKKAFKRVPPNASFRLSASQMARADRLDAKEAKLRQSLEKEKEREKNKKKREMKEEREREVKRRMLEEGKLRVEDTWGKVSASQPRLHGFLGGASGVQKLKNGKEESVDVKGDLERSDGEEERAENNAEERSSGRRRCCDDVSERQSQEPETASQQLQQVQQRTPREATDHLVGEGTYGLDKASSRRLRHERTPARSRTAPSSPLKEFRPSQINAQSPSLPNPRLSAKVDQCPVDGCSPQHKAPSPRSARLGDPLTRSWSSQRALSASKGQPVSQQPRDNSNVLGHGLEDFTEGIDDETFLLMCSTQKPRPTTEDIAPTRESTVELDLDEDTDTPPAPPDEEGLDKSNMKSGSPKAAFESFTSEFDKIEDEELIALLDEDEARRNTRQPLQQWPSESGIISRAPKSESPGLCASISLATKPPNGPTTLNPMLPPPARTGTQDETRIAPTARKSRRRLPDSFHWKDEEDLFGEMGAATQAAFESIV
jgi:hypothetical protein